jgi:hypothetical protein
MTPPRIVKKLGISEKNKSPAKMFIGNRTYLKDAIKEASAIV